MNTKTLFNKLKKVKLGSNACNFSLEKCEKLIPIINEINKLKKQKNAVILAHSYVSPEILTSVADYVGDSFELSKIAKNVKEDTIIFSAVKFMAETAKILNPSKNVLIPTFINSCTLADSITAEDVKKLKKIYLTHTFVCYINTTAEVKAECDYVVTSSNALRILQNIPNDKIYFLPDALMAKNLQLELSTSGFNKEIKYWSGSCYVHEEYSPEMLEYLKLEYPNLLIAAHPECSPKVIEKADYIGSTSQIIEFVKKFPGKKYFLVTECGLISRLNLELPHTKFLGSCTICRYMKANTLENILEVLKNPQPENTISIEENIRIKAKRALDNMLSI